MNILCVAYLKNLVKPEHKNLSHLGLKAGHWMRSLFIFLKLIQFLVVLSLRYFLDIGF